MMNHYHPLSKGLKPCWFSRLIEQGELGLVSLKKVLSGKIVVGLLRLSLKYSELLSSGSISILIIFFLFNNLAASTYGGKKITTEVSEIYTKEGP